MAGRSVLPRTRSAHSSRFGIDDRPRGWMFLSCVAFLILLMGACGSGDGGGADEDASGSAPRLVVRGQELYEETCAACHGEDLQGTDTGPPFLSPIYAPNHHSDESFYAAVQNGVQPHHWDFGPMPAQPSVTPEEVAAIVAYVRSEQEAAGIVEDPSHP